MFFLLFFYSGLPKDRSETLKIKIIPAKRNSGYGWSICNKTRIAWMDFDLEIKVWWFSLIVFVNIYLFNIYCLLKGMNEKPNIW